MLGIGRSISRHRSGTLRRLDDFGKKIRHDSRSARGPLDVTDEAAYAAQAVVRWRCATFERLDVVVNERRVRCDIAPFEQLSAERFKAVMDTNFYGVVNTSPVRPFRRCASKGAERPHPPDIVGRRAA